MTLLDLTVLVGTTVFRCIDWPDFRSNLSQNIVFTSTEFFSVIPQSLPRDWPPNHSYHR